MKHPLIMFTELREKRTGQLWQVAEIGGNPQGFVAEGSTVHVSHFAYNLEGPGGLKREAWDYEIDRDYTLEE